MRAHQTQVAIETAMIADHAYSIIADAVINRDLDESVEEWKKYKVAALEQLKNMETFASAEEVSAMVSKNSESSQNSQRRAGDSSQAA